MDADVEDDAVGPERVRPDDQHAVVRGRRAGPDVAIAVGYQGTVGDGQTIARTIVTDINIARVGPERARIAHHDNVVRRGRLIADPASNVRHLSPVGNGQAAARTSVADIDIERICPECPRIAHHHRVVRGRTAGSDVASAVGYLGTSINHQTVAAAVEADNQLTAVGPERVRSGDQHAVVVSRRFFADVGNGARDPAAVGNNEAVTTAA